MTDLSHLTVPAPPPSERDWNDDGVVILEQVLPTHLMNVYEREWLEAHGVRGVITQPLGYPDATPYTRAPALRALACYAPVARAIERLIDDEPGLHLCLTGWVSTERNWHQDGYLNPLHVGDRYAAAWFALENVDARSGPFQFVPGSHRWPQVTHELIGRYVNLEDPLWPKATERLLTPLFEREIIARDAPVVSYLPRRGDVLLWHPRLLHRGSTPTVPGLTRRALICHYSGVHHRGDMPVPRPTEGAWYFPIESTQPVR